MKRKLVSYTFLSALIWGILFVPDIHSTNLTQEEQLIRVGIGAFNDGFYDIAEKQFSKFLKDYPNHLKYYDISYLLGKTLLLKGKYREAKSYRGDGEGEMHSKRSPCTNRGELFP